MIYCGGGGHDDDEDGDDGEDGDADEDGDEEEDSDDGGDESKDGIEEALIMMEGKEHSIHKKSERPSRITEVRKRSNLRGNDSD